MGTNNLVFLEVIEWLDSDEGGMVRRFPSKGSGEIKFGAQLIVRPSQTAVFFYKGKAIHIFGPGTHTLETLNIPILTKFASFPWGFTSPLRADVFILNMKVFTDLEWQTADPVAFKDSKLGLIRLQASGVFNIRIAQPMLFINSLVGTLSSFYTADIIDYLGTVVVSRFNDHLSENLDTMINLTGRYTELAEGLSKRLAEDFGHFGLGLQRFYIRSITPPPDVQKAIDDRSKLGLFDNLNDLLKMKAAMALEKASENDGAAGQAAGMGVGMALPAMVSQFLQQPPAAEAQKTQQCHECSNTIPMDSRFCCYCGHQLLIFAQCKSCGKNLPPNAQFCSRCGTPAINEPQSKICATCKYENLFNAVFCNKCGEKL